jgi:hypothetical protein
MATKRNLFLRRMAQVGMDLGFISTKLTFYVVIAVLTYYLGGAFLLSFLPNPGALAGYTIIMDLVIALQIFQMVRRDREETTRIGFEREVDHFMDTFPYGRLRK